MTKEELENKLNKSEYKLQIEWVNHDKNGFSIDLLVRTNFGTEFLIEWHVNELKFLLNGLIIHTDTFRINSNYPHKYKYDIRIGNFCVIIPITKHKHNR